MSSRGFIGCLFLISTVILAGCAGLEKMPVQILQTSTVDTTSYQEKAEAFEGEGELEAALLYWRVIRSMNPLHPEAGDEIERLQAEIQEQSSRFFQKGLDAYRDRQMAAAREAFLAALRVNSQHRKALEYLYRSTEGLRYDLHRVKPRETYDSLARRFYRDAGMAVLIARFNDSDPTATPVPGTTLRIPKTALPKPVPRPRPKPAPIPDLAQAQRFFRDGEFSRAADMAEQILAAVPGDSEASRLYNSALLEEAARLSKSKDYPSAMALLRKADPQWPGVHPAIKDLRQTMDALAEDHYRLGVKFFVDEELELAIREWEKTLMLNPDHDKAAASITEVRDLLNALKKNLPVTVPPRP